MSLELISEVWQLIKPCIETGDTAEAAELLVNYLVEEDYSAKEIKQYLGRDKEVKKALDYYLETPDHTADMDESLFDEDDDLDFFEVE